MTPSPKIVERQVVVQREEVSDVMLAAFAAMGYALSARLLLLLSLIGAFALGYMAMARGTVTAIVCLALYCALTVLPFIWLEAKGRRPKE